MALALISITTCFFTGAGGAEMSPNRIASGTVPSSHHSVRWNAFMVLGEDIGCVGLHRAAGGTGFRAHRLRNATTNGNECQMVGWLYLDLAMIDSPCFRRSWMRLR